MGTLSFYQRHSQPISLLTWIVWMPVAFNLFMSAALIPKSWSKSIANIVLSQAFGAAFPIVVSLRALAFATAFEAELPL